VKKKWQCVSAQWNKAVTIWVKNGVEPFLRLAMVVIFGIAAKIITA
jgi:hypothetical protein